MNLKEMVDETLQSGITPIVLDYEDVRFFGSENRVVRSFMVLNSLDLGTLTMKEYRFVARRTKQGDHMIRRHIEKLVRVIPKLCEQNPKVECFTIPTYARLLKGGVLAGMLFDAFTLYPDTPANKLCIELSADILYEDMEETTERVAEHRARRQHRARALLKHKHTSTPLHASSWDTDKIEDSTAVLSSIFYP